ncbi:MAG: CCA tRNA nucleotidyltransferase [Alphaproteobacteria bacterium]|nr:CCA tRNA nucleotidyltransferase [Alphaproteobacteria bacterium]
MSEIRLPPQPWRVRSDTVAVLDALEAAGGPDCARFVGGCVRNALIGVDVHDIDIATTLHPEAVIRALESAGLRAISTGIAHGTITALPERRPFEITTLRRDVETDGRHAVVAFTDDWRQDAARRDFRLNALYADREGRVFDPTGEGVADARAGRIVFVGDPHQRIAEDALRIIRYFRFYAWYGRGEPDASALAACAAGVDRIGGLSAERLAQETLKLLDAEDPRAAVRAMAGAGVLTRLIPSAANLRTFEALVRIESEILFAHDPLLRLAALISEAPEPQLAARSLAESLRLSRAQGERLVEALGRDAELVSWLSPRQTRRLVYRLGPRVFRDRVLLAWASSTRPAAAIQWRALLPMGETWTAPRLPLSGEEVAAAGVPQGPLIGRVLREVEAWWIDQDFIDDKLSVMERLKAVVQGLVL